MPVSGHDSHHKTAVRDAGWVNDIRLTGNRAAYTALMEAYYDKVLRRIYKLTGNASDAEDLAMETFVKAFNRLDSYTVKFPFSTWLYAIARNQAIDFLRQHRNDNDSVLSELDHDLTGMSFEVPDMLPGPEQQLIAKQVKDLLRDTVESLPVKYRDIIKLHYYDEYSVEEIALRLNMPVNTVKIRLFRARALLSAIYANQGFSSRD